MPHVRRKTWSDLEGINHAPRLTPHDPLQRPTPNCHAEQTKHRGKR